MEAAPALAEQYRDTKCIFFSQDHLSPLQLHNLGAHLVIPHCLKVIGSKMFASEIGWDLNQAVINIY